MIRPALAALLLTPGHLLHAQEASVFLGGTHARYADSLAGTAGFVSMRLDASTTHTAGRLAFSLSQFTGGEWAVQLSGHATAVAPLGRRWTLGLVAGGALNDIANGSASGTAAGGPHVTLAVPHGLVSFGLGFGGVRRVDETGATVATGSVALRRRLRSAVQLVVGVTGTAVGTLRLAEGRAEITWRQRPVELSVGGGVRLGDLADDPWGHVRFSWHALPFAALEGSVGRYPQDITGFTDGLYAQLGVRVGAIGRRRQLRQIDEPPVRVFRHADGSMRIEFPLRQATERVALAGDWNDWTPTPLRRGDNGRWIAELQLAPGVYYYALVVDGEWTLPDGVDGVPDDFGGRVGVLLVN